MVVRFTRMSEAKGRVGIGRGVVRSVEEPELSTLPCVCYSRPMDDHGERRRGLVGKEKCKKISGGRRKARVGRTENSDSEPKKTKASEAKK